MVGGASAPNRPWTRRLSSCRRVAGGTATFGQIPRKRTVGWSPPSTPRIARRTNSPSKCSDWAKAFGRLSLLASNRPARAIKKSAEALKKLICPIDSVDGTFVYSNLSKIFSVFENVISLNFSISFSNDP